MAEIATNLQDLATYWAGAKAGERANLQTYVSRLCRALLLPEPGYRGSGYEFELQIDAITVEGKESANFIDCWKTDCFALEGKDDAPGAKGKAANEALLRRAFGQVRNYVHHVPGAVPPPYLLVLDVGATLIVWDRWAGTYGGFEAGHRVDLATLHQRPADIALLRDVWLDPSARDRRGAAQAVTTEIAATLAQLAAALEDRGHDQEEVARFLMRVVFSCFAEDVGLLPPESFRQTVTEAGLKGSPKEFTEAIESLWHLMDIGGRVGPMKFLRFNGHFFKDATALPLTRAELVLVEAAARADWAEVEPSIFGTLLTRALDPEERHRLGAEYTPRAFIERLVRPTIEEPVLERWTAVQAEVVQLLASEKAKDRTTAEARLLEFHAWLRGLRVLDPACGSGNFLYVAMHALKRIELEVIRSIARVTGQASLRMEEIGPWQFYGIEVKPWAREIAELTLWIGFHQFWRLHHDVQPPEPILQDTGTLECRDAVLAWNAITLSTRPGRPDPTPRHRHAVSNELVPDMLTRLPYYEYDGAREALWPDADFIVGNPPYLGKSRQREAFGEGYVNALRRVYTEVPDSADFVMYWWHRAARAVASGRTIRAGLITTNSITQKFHQPLITAADEAGARIIWAIPDHPWSDEVGGADVRVAMTVLGAPSGGALRMEVSDDGAVLRQVRVPRLNADLSVGADLTGMTPLRAMDGLCVPGMQLDGSGFIVQAKQATSLLEADVRLHDVIKPYRNGRDLMTSPRDAYVIDFGMMTEQEARKYPVPFDIVRTLVYPQRQGNARPSYRAYWWRFAEPRRTLRTALEGLSRFIVTTRTSRRRVFSFMPAGTVPDSKIVCIATGDAYVLGVVSSRIHVMWAAAAGGRLGVGNDASYDKARCFDPFPFPDATATQRTHIADLAERIESHRRDVVGKGPAVTLTNIYAVLEKLRSGDPLTAKERTVHTLGACSSLKDLHDKLDEAVADAYGWSWPEPPAAVLERLVALHDQRVVEEMTGIVRWLRPEFQRPRFGTVDVEHDVTLDLDDESGAPAEIAGKAISESPALMPWPTDAIGQITALRAMTAAAPVNTEEAARQFSGARRDIVTRHLDTLALIGEVVVDESGRYRLAPGGLAAV